MHVGQMSKYLRNKIKGGCWVFTSCVETPEDFALTDHIDQLRASFHCVMNARPWYIDAITVLPDRIQTVWTLPEGDVDFSGRWASIKANFSRNVPKTEYVSPARANRGERGIWQRRFLGQQIYGSRERDAMRRRCYRLPVLLGLAHSPEDWPYSSYHRDLRLGLFERQAYLKRNADNLRLAG